jgi:hypothetical protein
VELVNLDRLAVAVFTDDKDNAYEQVEDYLEGTDVR